MKKKGFTLIELLIVIAIIGVLASVVLASLNNARIKGTDAAIKSDLNGLREEAAIYYDDNSQFYATTPYALGACPTTASTGNIFADSKILSAITDAITKNGGGAASISQCVATATTWAVAVQLKTSDGAGVNPDSWCVDSVGASRAYEYGAGSIANAINVDACN